MTTTSKFNRREPNALRALLCSLALAMLAWVPVAGASDKAADGISAKAVRQTIVRCGDNLSEPGRYRLAEDLLCTKTIKITSSDVNLNLAGHTITCSSPEEWEFPPTADGTGIETGNEWVTGIEVNFEQRGDDPVITGVHIRNGGITNCGGGLLVNRMSASEISNMRLYRNTLEENNCCLVYGLELVDSHDNLIRANRMFENIDGFDMFSSTGNTIVNNWFSGNGSGLFLSDGSSGNTVHGNRINDNALWGMLLQFSSENRILNNELSANGLDGMALILFSDGNFIRNNRIRNSGRAGIAVAGLPDFEAPVPAGNDIRSNRVNGSGVADLVEGNVFLPDFDVFGPTDECASIWENNQFETSFGPPDCFQ
jgi:parallel beta-helix repeat protein